MSRKHSLPFLTLFIIMLGTVLSAAFVLDLSNQSLPESSVNTDSMIESYNVPHSSGGWESPKLLGEVDYEDVSAIKVQGNYGYVLSESEGIYVLNVTDVENPTQISFFSKNVSGQAVNFWLDDDKLYLTCQESGVLVLDIEDPEHIVRLGVYNESSQIARDVVVRDSIAFIADEAFGINIVNFSNPALPVKVGNYSIAPLVPRRLFLNENKLFVVLEEHSFQIIDIEDIENPSLLLAHYLGGYPSSIYVVDHYVYLTYSQIDSDEDNGMEIYDIATILAPILIGTYEVPAYNIEVANETVYLSCGITGFHMINVTQPTAPVLLKSFGNYVFSLDVVESVVFTAQVLNRGIRIYDSGIDSDDDGISNWDETTLFMTNPFDWDTDNDGYSDSEEIAGNSNPLDPLDIPIPTPWYEYVLVIGFVVVSFLVSVFVFRIVVKRYSSK